MQYDYAIMYYIIRHASITSVVLLFLEMIHTGIEGSAARTTASGKLPPNREVYGF
jgi:hypothetical protein